MARCSHHVCLKKSLMYSSNFRYNELLPRDFSERDIDQIRNKFKSLKNMRKTTGEGSIPWETNEAKRIQKKIEESIAVMNIGESSSSEGIVELV